MDDIMSGGVVGPLRLRCLPRQSRVDRRGRTALGTPPNTVGPVAAYPGTATSALLIFDRELCRNGGTIEALGEVWELADSLPLGWRTLGERFGELTVIEDQNATFVADDGTELRVTLGGDEDICFP